MKGNTLKKIITTVVAAAAFATPAFVAAQPAQAATNPPCATRAEFNRIHVGQSLGTVAAIVGGPGKVTLASSYLTIRQWGVCGSPFGIMSLGFTNRRVQSKTFIG